MKSLLRRSLGANKSSRPVSDVDALVIGAGVAGLAAAVELARARLQVAVVEARNRIGGRILTLPLPGWARPAELGAEFLHALPESMTSIVRAANLSQETVPERHWAAQNGWLQPVPDLSDRFDGIARRIGPWFPGSFNDWLHGPGADLPEEDKRWMQQMVQGFHAADPARMSARTLFNAAGGSETQVRLVQGYGRVVKHLQDQLIRLGSKLWLNAPVDTIRWRPGTVDVTSAAAAQAWSAKLAVVTLPLGVLRAAGAPGAVAFDPPLRDRDARWQGLGWGHVLRIVIRFADALWTLPVLPGPLREQDGRGFGFLHGATAEFPVWWAQAPQPVLVGWWGGPAAGEAATRLANEDIFRLALRSLAQSIGASTTAVEQQVVDWRLHNWTTDRYSRGAYSFSVAGLDISAEASGEPEADTLFFAGEAFAKAVDVGTVHGALESGKAMGRRAAELLQQKRAGVRRRLRTDRA